MNTTIFKFIICLVLSGSALGSNVSEEIAFTVDGMEIPIIVVAPDKGSGPFPVVYHVHGGGWNGGTENSVPDASVYSGLRYLSDELGVIHVGLAYRGKLQGDFQDGLEDLRASIKWFEERADDYGANLSKVGLSGGSAGTPLSALLAQEMPTCKTYTGFFGVYDLLDNDASLFPNEEACVAYGLSEKEQKRKASAFHNLRAHPPASLLFHGGKDILTHPTQSLRYAERLKQQGAIAEAIIYPEVNHGYFSERYPVEFKDTALRIAQFYVDHLDVDPAVLANLEAHVDAHVAGYFPKEKIDAESVLGEWKSSKGSYRFVDEANGVWSDQRKRTELFTYKLESGSLTIKGGDSVTVLLMQHDGRAIYEIIENDVRRTGQRFHFRKQP